MAYKNARSYQVYNDLLDSKGSMEPIAIATGIGPCVGFDIIDTNKNYFNITGSNLIGLSATNLNQSRNVRGSNRYTNISTKANVVEQVVNAHITPDGLLHVDTPSLDFTNLTMSFTANSLQNNVRFIAVKAMHTFVGAIQTNPPQPSLLNFTAIELPVNSFVNTPGRPHDVSTLSNMTFTQLRSAMATSGFTINDDTEVFIGLYIIGCHNTIPAGPLRDFYASAGYIIPLIAYNGNWPPIRSLSIPELIALKASIPGVIDRIEDLEDNVVNYIPNGSIGSNKLAPEAAITNIQPNTLPGGDIVDGSISRNKMNIRSLGSLNFGYSRMFCPDGNTVTETTPASLNRGLGFTEYVGNNYDIIASNSSRIITWQMPVAHRGKAFMVICTPYDQGNGSAIVCDASETSSTFICTFKSPQDDLDITTVDITFDIMLFTLYDSWD